MHYWQHSAADAQLFLHIAHTINPGIVILFSHAPAPVLVMRPLILLLFKPSAFLNLKISLNFSLIAPFNSPPRTIKELLAQDTSGGKITT